MKNFVSSGEVLTIPAPATVASGDVVIAGGLVGIAAHDAASGDAVTIKLGGVYELPKVAAEAWTLGAAIYWDAGDKVCTTDDDSGSNAQIGHAAAAAANPSSTGLVRLG
jgi:Uncharacterized conserved protein